MFVAYILRKTRFLKLNIVRGDKEVFRYKSIDYNVDPECIYLKKAFGIKFFRFAMYMEGIKNPLKFDFNTGQINIKQVPINYVAQLMNKLKFMKLEIIMVVLLVIILLTTIITYMQVSDMFA